MVISNQFDFKLEHTLAITPIGFSKSVEESLPNVIKQIASTLQPEKIILFGSYATGTPTPDSDVDLLVIINTNLPPSQRYLAVSRLLRPRPFPVDILVKTPAEIKRALNTGDFFIKEILRQGQILYERI
jgi:predicted nucleotidyltransferase